jgi:hypothetical protein
MSGPDAVSGNSDDRFAPRWTGCIGVFNETGELNSRENEELHYRKHVVLGREWERDLSLSEYRDQAIEHLNSVDGENVIELCQAEDLAVVKYNISSGDLGIVRADDGAIKTYFRPKDFQYVLRKVNAGAWDEPAIADGFETAPDARTVSDDPDVGYLFTRLELLAATLPSVAHEVVLGFADRAIHSDDVLSMLARLGEYRFCVFELQRRVLTEAQNDAMFRYRKQVVWAVASFEALERYRSRELIEAIVAGLESKIAALQGLWVESSALIRNVDEFESALDDRQLVGYAILELRVLRIHRRLLDFVVERYERQLLKNDIYLRSIIYQLTVRFRYEEQQRVAPEEFFWRRMTKNVG